MSQMQLCHIVTGLNRGGAERALHTLLTNGLQDHFQNRVISLMDEGVYGARFVELGVPVTTIKLNRGRLSFGGLRRLMQNLSEDPPNILQGWMYHGNLAATLGSFILPARPILVWNIRCAVGSYGDIGRSTHALLQLLKLMSAVPDSILYNSSNARSQHMKFGFLDQRAQVIPNGFNLLEWQPSPSKREAARKAIHLPSKAQVVGYIGRNHPQKDLKTLFSAISRLRATRPLPHFVLIGADLKAAMPHGFPEQNLTFLGDQSDLAAIIPAFDFLCLTSRSEGFPNVLGEAMACGVPCITTDAGDAEMIVGETGWVVPREDPEALAAALRNVLLTPPNELSKRGDAARTRIETTFSSASAVAKYTKLYEGLIARRQQCAE
ncbi:glycosyltransferase [Cypionkella sp.]|uniref:glycosyltransferase n=1 Tax=Cypionkella sp. TaxID=2811411 RepID=UPI0037513B2A